jgi:xylulokinase
MMEKGSPLILTIDSGTTSCKAGLVTPYGEVLAWVKSEKSAPIYFLPKGGAEQNPEECWAIILSTVQRLKEEFPIPPERIAAIAVTAPWSTTVPVDKEGKLLGNTIMWMDTRGAPYVKEITRGLLNFQGYGLGKIFTWVRLTGGIPTHAGKDPIGHILFLKNERPEVYKAAYKFLELKDYLNLRLTGKFASDYATIALYWLTDNRDINNVRYDQRLLRLAGIDLEKLPPLYPTTHVLGTLLPGPAEELGLPPGMPVVISTPDYHASVLGSGALQDYEPHIYVGTSSWLSCHVPFKKTDLVHSIGSLPSALPGRYFIANEQECAGSCLTFLLKLFFAQDALGTGPMPENPYKKLDELASSAPVGSGGVIFAPWLYGERTPVEDPSLRGSFFNLSLGTTRAEIVRAVMEGVALNLRWLLPCVEGFIGRRFGDINIIGGGGSSEIWCQIFADVLGRPIRQVKDPAAAGLRGLGILASLSLGLSDLESCTKGVAIAKTFKPDPQNHKIYTEIFEAFMQFYRNNRSLFRRLNPI